MNKLPVLLLILLSGVFLFPNDYKWVKSGRYATFDNIWEPHISSTGKYYIYMEPYGTHFINIETGNLEKTFNLISFFEIETAKSDSVLIMNFSPIASFDLINDTIISSCLDIIPDFYFVEIGHGEGNTALSANSERLGLMALYGGLESNNNSNQIVICDYKNCQIFDRIVLPIAYGLIFLENENKLLYSDNQGIWIYDINQKKVISKKAFINATNFIKSNDEKLLAFHRFTTSQTSKLTIVDNLYSVIAEIDCKDLDNLSSFYSAFSPDKKFIAYCNNNNIEIFDIVNKKLVKTIKTQFQPNFIFFCESGRSIIAANEVLGFSVLYDAETGNKKRTLVANDDEISYIKFSPDGKYIVTLGKDRKLIKLINTDNGNLEKIYEITNSLTENDYYHMDVSNSQISISTYVNEYLVIDYVSDKQDYIKSDDIVSDVIFSPDGSKYAVSTDNGKIKLLSAASKSIIYETKLDGDNTIYKLGFSSEGRELYIFSKNKTSGILSLYSWDFINLPQNMNRNFDGLDNYIYEKRYIEFINNKYLATRIFIYNIQEDEFNFNFPKYSTDGIDISKDDKTILYSQINRSSSEYNYFDKYNFAENSLQKRFYVGNYVKNKDFLFEDDKYNWIEPRSNTPHCVAFSPDNKYIGVGLYNGVLMMINNDTLVTSVFNDNKSVSDINVYPNPFGDKINIKINRYNDDLLKIEIFDICNSKVYNSSDLSEIADSEVSINTSSLSKGVYFLQLTFRKSKLLYKIISIYD